MALPIEKMNLPTLRKAKSKQSILRPIPMEKVGYLIKEYFKHDGYFPNDEIKSLDELHRLIIFLRDQMLKLTFGDWRYSLTDIYRWSAVETITFELFAEKKNMKLQLSINKFYMTDHDLSEFASDPGPDKPNMTVADVMKMMMDFFATANEHIEEWNNISMEHKPIIAERPPFEDMVDWLFEKFHESFEYGYHASKEYGYTDSWKEYLMEKEVYPAEIITDEVYDINYNSMSFGPHGLFVDFVELGDDPYYGYYMFDVYVMTEDVGIKFLVDSLEISKGDQFSYDEVESLFRCFEYDLYDAAKQWNIILGR
jgi:hypothetical protein